MNANLTFDGVDPFEDPVDRLLAEIALGLQLPPSLHREATARYQAVRRRLESTTAFKDAVEHFYPQGSMAIDATIAIRGTDDEYDLDIVAQLGGRFRHLSPLATLLELEDALKDYPSDSLCHPAICRQDASRHYTGAAGLGWNRAREFDRSCEGTPTLR